MGVEHEGGVLAAGARRRSEMRRIAPAGGEIPGPLDRASRREDRRIAGQRVRHRGGERRVGPDDRGPRSTVGDQRRDVARAEPVVEQHRHRGQALQGEQEDRVVEAAGKHRRHPVAGAQAARGEAGGDALDLGDELGIGERPFRQVVDDGDAVRGPLGGQPDEVERGLHGFPSGPCCGFASVDGGPSR